MTTATDLEDAPRAAAPRLTLVALLQRRGGARRGPRQHAPRAGARAVLFRATVAGAAGLAIGAAFPGRSWWPLASIGVALLLAAVHGCRPTWAASTALLAGSVFFLPHLWWAVVASGSVLGWIVLALAQASSWAVFAVSWVVVARLRPVLTHPGAQPWVAAVLWVAVEQLRAQWPLGGFPWALLAYSQSESPLLRLAPWGGSALVSAMVVVLGGYLYLCGWSLRHRALPAATGSLVAVLALSAAAALTPHPTLVDAGTMLVGVVQGNVPGPELSGERRARQVLENHVQGTRALAEESSAAELDLVLWPESSTDIDPRRDAAAARRVQAAALAVQAPIAVGTQRYVPDGRYNEYVLWSAQEGASPQVYAKQRPVPFGEYIPARAWIRRLTAAVDQVTVDMLPGESRATFEVPVPRLARAVPLAVGICFEVAFDEPLRGAVRDGGELIVIPTNNASFGYTQEASQQLAMGRFQAAQHGRALVQVSTVGRSAVISPEGGLLWSSGLFTSDRTVMQVPLRTGLTLADRLGALPGRTAVGAAVALLVVGVLTGGPKRRQGRPLRGCTSSTGARVEGAGALHGAPAEGLAR
ncbi:apolipoprotein N-acyltransferase [Cellulomonas marina]|uniref:apolipoprotein N-acyltransferase n=1 Tax=Cellulomonas marina TaxID=988821 RepID=UPI000B7F8E8A|nr:apolipoprotein N-acyltransferase [Cellulomonas marina]